MKTKHPWAFRAKAGFTMIELMTVITIMLILAALGVGGMGFVQERQNKEKARVDVNRLALAIEAYKADNGEYPGDDANTPVDGDVSKELYDALFYDGYTSINDPNAAEIPIYVAELDPRNSKQSWVDVERGNTPLPSQSIRDPWGRGYRYRKGANAQNPDFDLWSMGKDGVSNFTNPDRNLEGNADDIRNF